MTPTGNIHDPHYYPARDCKPHADAVGRPSSSFADGVTSERKSPPLHARLDWYLLTASEKSLLKAMLQHCSNGSLIWPSIKRLAAYAKISERQIQRLIHGYRDLKGVWHRSLLERGILSCLAPANTSKRRPATYRINEAALELDPRMSEYLAKYRQDILPGVKRPTAPGEPIELPGDTASPSKAVDLVTPCRQSGDNTTPDSVFDSSNNSKTLIRHAEGALTLSGWLAIKDQLRDLLSPEEWDLWVRPARFLRAMSGCSFLVAVPPSRKIMAAAAARRELLHELAGSVGLSISLTRYPDDWERAQLKERFDIELEKDLPK